MKEKVIVVGVGERFYKMWDTIVHIYDIVALLDNNVRGNVKGINVYGLSEIVNYVYDKVLVLPINYMFDLRNQLLKLEVSADKIIPYLGENKALKITDYKYKNNKILFDNGIVRFEFDSNSGHGGVNGIFFNNVYNCAWGEAEDTIVIDIGANIGLSSLFFAANPNVKKVIGYEPLGTTFQKALHNVDINEDGIKEKIAIYNYALSNTNKEKKVTYIQHNRTSFNIFNNSDDFYGKLEKIHVRDASEILEPIFQEHYNENIIVKMDCEGSEYEIFESLENSSLIGKVDIFMIEFHLQDKGIIEKYLINNGFRYIKTNTASHIGFIYAFNNKKRVEE